jgi:hypothetical protein
MCEQLFEKLSSQIDISKISLTLSLGKEINDLFSKKLFTNLNSSSYGGNHKLIFEELETDQIQYIGSTSINGANVIFVESLLLFPWTIETALGWLRDQGANILGVIILFDASIEQVNYASFGIDPQNVFIGCSINMDMSETSNCKCIASDNSIDCRILKYNQY